MSETSSMARRRFLYSSVLYGAGLVAAGPRLAGATAVRKLEILEPIYGAVLHRRLGREAPDGLEIEVSGIAPAAMEVLVQGRATTRDGEKFRGTAILRERENEIVAAVHGEGGRQVARIRVLWDWHSQKRYLFVIDDNSFFLRDIT